MCSPSADSTNLIQAFKAPSRLPLGSEVEAREPTPVACMLCPYRTRGQWGEPYGVVHKGGVQLLSYLILSIDE
jgi:hypothetical protein